MFIDYFEILGISPNFTDDELKAAFRQQAIRWHPDRNLGSDTTERMQRINEAYLILKDAESRERYRAEYTRYQDFTQAKRNQQSPPQPRPEEQSRPQQPKDFAVEDETLHRWMNNARKQARSMAQQSLEDLIGMSKAGGKAMLNAAGAGVLRLIIFSALIAILVHTCQQ